MLNKEQEEIIKATIQHLQYVLPVFSTLNGHEIVVETTACILNKYFESIGVKLKVEPLTHHYCEDCGVKISKLQHGIHPWVTFKCDDCQQSTHNPLNDKE